MAHLEIPLISPEGYQVTFVSSDHEEKELMAAYPGYLKWLSDNGFQPKKAGTYGRKDDRIAYDVNATVNCKTCGQRMTPRQGIGKNGKPWYAYFCSVKEHEPLWAK